MAGGLRSLLSGALLVLATAAAVVAIWCVWAERQLLDTATFTTRSVEVVRDPAVREETAAFLASQLVDQQEAVREAAGQLSPELQATVNSLLEGGGETAQATALEALESGTFDGLWAEAMTGTHGAFVRWLDEPGQDVDLDLQPLIERLARDVGLPDQLIAAGSDAAGAGTVPIIEAGQYEQTRQFARRLERGAALMAPVAIVAAVLSVLLARRRRWAVVRAGVGAAIAGIIAAVTAPWIGDQLVAAMADDGAATAVAQAIWASVEPPLSQLALLVVAAGASVALLATIAWPGGARSEDARLGGVAHRLRGCRGVVLALEHGADRRREALQELAGHVG